MEAESKHLYARLEGLTNRDLPPEEKLLNYINIRLEAVKEAVVRNGTLRAEFSGIFGKWRRPGGV